MTQMHAKGAVQASPVWRGPGCRFGAGRVPVRRGQGAGSARAGCRFGRAGPQPARCGPVISSASPPDPCPVLIGVSVHDL